MTAAPAPPDHESLARQAASFLDLPIDPAHLRGVADNLALLAAHAARIMALPLPPDLEPAPVFVA